MNFLCPFRELGAVEAASNPIDWDQVGKQHVAANSWPIFDNGVMAL